MKLYQFNEWKADAIVYWTDRASGSPNGLQGTPASGTEPHYANSEILSSFVIEKLNETETKYHNYMADASLLDKTKDSLLSLMAYVSMKDIVTVIGGPPITNILSDIRNWYSLYTYDLPEKETLFNLNHEIVDGNFAGYFSNSDLVNSNRWYSGETLDSPPITGSYFLYTNNGVITSNTVSAINLVEAVALDINSIGVFINASQSSTRDNIIFRMYGEPESIVSKRKAKTFIMEDYKLQLVLTDFGWTIQGLN